jgi:hypothetical protein
MSPILNETITNYNENISCNQINPNDINDYVYDMIFIKTKKAININVQRNKKFIKKYVDKYDSNKETPNLTNVNNILKNNLE